MVVWNNLFIGSYYFGDGFIGEFFFFGGISFRCSKLSFRGFVKLVSFLELLFFLKLCEYDLLNEI